MKVQRESKPPSRTGWYGFWNIEGVPTFKRPDAQGVQLHREAVAVFGPELLRNGRSHRGTGVRKGKRVACLVCGRTAGLDSQGEIVSHPTDEGRCYGVA